MATGNRNRALPAALAVLGIGLLTTLAAWHSARTAAEASARERFERQAAEVASSLPVVVLASGAAVTSLLAWLAFAIGRTRDQALAIAAGMTAELRATTAELQAIYDSSPLGVYRTDAGGRVVSVNRRGEEICGLPAQRLLGATWVSAIHAGDRVGVEAAWARAAGGEGRYENELRLQRGDGRWVWLSVKSAPLFRLGKLDGHVGTIEDVTARHEAMAELERNRTFLTHLVDALPNPIFVKDSRHRWILVNQAFCALLGRPREALLHQDDRLVYDADTVRVWFEEDDRVLDSGAPLVVERPLHAVEGSGRWLLKSKSRITLMDGSFGVAGLMTDVTALKQAQAQAQSARELLDAVIDAVPTVVSLKDEAGRWVLLNRAFRDFHDRPGSDYLGKTDEEVYGPAVAARHHREDAQARASDVVLRLDGPFQTVDGEPRWVVRRKRGVTLPGGVRGVVTAVHDRNRPAPRHARGRAQPALAGRHHRRHPPAGVRQGPRPSLGNGQPGVLPHARRIQGGPGRTVRRGAAACRKRPLYSTPRTTATFASPAPLRFEGPGLSPLQSDVWVVRNKAAVRLDDGELVLVGVVTDITDFRRAALEAERARRVSRTR